MSPEKQMEEALNALNVLKKSDITELKAMGSPPVLVKYVTDAICILVNKKYVQTVCKAFLADMRCHEHSYQL